MISVTKIFQRSFTYHWLTSRPTASSVLEKSVFVRKIFSLLSPFQDRLSEWYRRPLSFPGKWLMPLLLFSVIFVPRWNLATIASYYRLDLKLEDILIGLSALTLCLILAKRHDSDRTLAHLSVRTGGPSIESCFVFFLIACQVSIFHGLAARTIDKPLMSLLYLLKWTEYFLVFIAALRFTASRQSAYFFLKIFFALGLAAAAIGYWEYMFPSSKAVYPGYYRLYERFPFYGDANHMGGFFVLWMGFVGGLYLKSGNRKQQFLLLGALLFVFFPFIWTYSRKSYFALAGIFAVGLLIPRCRKRLIFLMSLLVLLALVLPTHLADRLKDLSEVLRETDPFHSSWAGNVDVWHRSFMHFDRLFLFGSGLGSRHRLFYESQYVLVLTETGVVGLGAFLVLLASLLREIAASFSRYAGDREKAVAVGWLLGFAGLLVHNLACVSWTVSKIAIPFWVFTGGVISLLRMGDWLQSQRLGVGNA